MTYDRPACQISTYKMSSKQSKLKRFHCELIHFWFRLIIQYSAVCVRHMCDLHINLRKCQTFDSIKHRLHLYAVTEFICVNIRFRENEILARAHTHTDTERRQINSLKVNGMRFILHSNNSVAL